MIRKLFIDSRFRYDGTDTDFSIDLPEPQEAPDGWSMWVNSVSFPHSWYSVNSSNRTLWLLEEDGGATYRRGVQIASQNYTLSTLAADLQTELNGVLGATGVYAVAVVEEGLTITRNLPFRIPSYNELNNPAWKGAVWAAATPRPGSSDYSASMPRDLNHVLNGPLQSAMGTSYNTGIVDLRSNHCVYLHSNLTNYSTLDWAGRKTIACRIPVEQDYGFTIQYRGSGSSEDAVDVSNLRFKNARFRLCDAFGIPLDLRAGHVTIELLFAATK